MSVALPVLPSAKLSGTGPAVIHCRPSAWFSVLPCALATTSPSFGSGLLLLALVVSCPVTLLSTRHALRFLLKLLERGLPVFERQLRFHSL